MPAAPPQMSLSSALEFCAEYVRMNSYFDGDRLKEKSTDALSMNDMRLIQCMAGERIHGAEQAFLIEQLGKALRDETIVAYGHLAPFKRGDKPKRIDPSQWVYLVLDIETESAQGKDQLYTGLRFGFVSQPTNHATANQSRRPTQKAEIIGIFDAHQRELMAMKGKADIYRCIQRIAQEKWGNEVKGFDVTTIRDHLHGEGKLSGWKKSKSI